MGNKGVLWNGKYDVLPGARSRIDSSALVQRTGGGQNTLAVLFEATGLLPPKQATLIGDPTLPLRYIDPSWEEARLASQLLFQPSTEVPGASSILMMPVNPATAASMAFGTAYSALSYLFGLTANQVRMKQENGTVAGKKISVVYQTVTETFDNLSKSSFSIQYTGDGTAAVMTIDVSAATHKLTTTITDAEADNLDLDFTDYTDIQALCDAINATGKYTATVLTSKPTDLCMQLDAVTAQAIKAAAYTAKSDLQALIDGVNLLSGYVKLTRTADATGVPANYNWTYLAGGTNGATATSDWQEAFDILKGMQVDFIYVVSSDESVHAMADAHAQYTLTRKKERRIFVGGALQTWTSPSNRTTSLTALKADAAALNSDRTMNPGIGSKHYDPDGNLKLYPAYITAAMYAGIAAGGSPVMPLTAKHLRCMGLEVDLLDDEAEALIEAGICPPIPDAVNGAGYLISRQVTTWNIDTDLRRIEFSVGRGADFLAAMVRRAHESFKGREGDEGADISIINATNSILQWAKDNGYIRSFDRKKTVLRVDNMTRYVDYSAVPILPINWIFSTYHMEPVQQTFTIGL